MDGNGGGLAQVFTAEFEVVDDGAVVLLAAEALALGFGSRAEAAFQQVVAGTGGRRRLGRAEHRKKLDKKGQQHENHADPPDGGFLPHAAGIEAQLMRQAGVVGEDGEEFFKHFGGTRFSRCCF